MTDVIEDREVWRLNLELLPPQPSRTGIPKQNRDAKLQKLRVSCRAIYEIVN